jgi:hypothetical protein
MSDPDRGVSLGRSVRATVLVEDDAVVERPGSQMPQRSGAGEPAEKPPSTLAAEDRHHRQQVLVDEVGLDQRPGKRDPPGDQEVRPGSSLQPGDLRLELAPNDRGSPPIGPGEGLREDDLRGLVESARLLAPIGGRGRVGRGQNPANCRYVPFPSSRVSTFDAAVCSRALSSCFQYGRSVMGTKPSGVSAAPSSVRCICSTTSRTRSLPHWRKRAAIFPPFRRAGSSPTGSDRDRSRQSAPGGRQPQSQRV